MEFGLVTVARTAQISEARAMIDSARRAGFTGTVHAVVLDVGAATDEDGWTSFLSVMPDPSVARRLMPLGLDDLYPAVVPHAVLHALRSENAVIYLAPTVRVLAGLADFAGLADEHLALVEHPDHRYSTSIVAATRAAMPSLEWWRDAALADLLGGEAPDAASVLDRLAQRFGVATALPSDRFTNHRDDGDDAVDDRPVLADGLPFDHIMRETYRMYLRDALDQHADPPPNPYDEPDTFVAWLQQSQFPTTPRVSRYLRQVYLSRPDLSRAFPEVPGRDTARFFAWAHDHGSHEIPIPPRLLPSKQVDSRPPTRVRPATTSVNLVGFIDALGIGEVARRIASALDEAAIAYAKVPFARTHLDRDAQFDARAAPHDINLVCINPDSLASFANYAGESFFADRYTIGVWFWETAELPPSMAWAFDLVDEVWAASDFVADAIRARAPSRVAVNVVTLPLVAPVVDPDFRLGDVGLDDKANTFVSSWDYLSVVDRKNPLGTVAAYTAAFPADHGTQLLLKGSNAERRPDDHQHLVHATRARPDIHLLTAQLTPANYAALLAAATAVVSLHRSEGLALNLADAIALGVPTIATAYGGNLQFMDPADTDLVPYELIDVGPGRHPYPSDAQWAEPDRAFAAKCMRQLVDDPRRARERAQQAQRRVTNAFSLERSAASVSRLLTTIAQPGTANAPLRSRLRARLHRSS